MVPFNGREMIHFLCLVPHYTLQTLMLLLCLPTPNANSSHISIFLTLWTVLFLFLILKFTYWTSFKHKRSCHHPTNVHPPCRNHVFITWSTLLGTGLSLTLCLQLTLARQMKILFQWILRYLRQAFAHVHFLSPHRKKSVIDIGTILDLKTRKGEQRTRRQ